MRESLLVVNKHRGPSSFDIVREIKKLSGGAKVGHAGSLDPFASGVLVILLERATKLSNALLNADKRYRAVVKLGTATDSMDCTGATTETKPVDSIPRERVEEVLQSFQGTWHQVPPMFSAKKVHGVRLYELARQNIHIRRSSVPVELYELKFLSYEGDIITFDVHCSKGTYVRALADEFARRLGSVGHLFELDRYTCGEFRIEESVSLEALSKNFSSYLEVGYQNYVRLLRSEALARRVSSAPYPGLQSKLGKTGDSVIRVGS